MNAILPRKQNIRLWLTALVLALPVLAEAQDPLPTPTPPPDPLAGVPVQVLDQQQITIGTHTIIYNRIAPPFLPAATPTPNPGPRPTPTTRTTNRSPQTPTKRKARSTGSTNAEGGEKQYKVLFLSATVYDHQFTEVRWFGGSNPALRAYVNIDFAYFTTVTTLETADTVYDLFFAWSNDTVDSLTQAGQTPPNLSSFPAGRSSYQIIAGDANANADALAALDALCVYYDANSTQMIAAYNQQQAANAAHQQWLIDHPPVQADTVINYWPTKGSIYLNQSH